MDKFIPLSVPNLKGNEKKYVIEAIESEWVSTGGQFIDRLEQEIAYYLKVQGAVACQSGTAGLHLALQLSGVGYGDAVFAPTLTFIAAVNPIRYLGASPIFIDCDSSLTMDDKKMLQYIEEECYYDGEGLYCKETKQRIKAVIVVHIFGNAAHMEEIMSIAKKYKLKVIEDATEALGTYYTNGTYKDAFLGTIGDFGVYSFNGNKIITTGGGGILVAKEQSSITKAKYLSTQAKDDPLYYEHQEIGYNYRMTNVQAAIGVGQLEQLEDFIEIKKKNYLLYKRLLKDVSEIELLDFDTSIRPNYWFYALLIKGDRIERDRLIKELQVQGIQTRPIWGLIHEQKPYRGSLKGSITEANYYRSHIINIPCSSNLSEVEVRRVVDTIKELIGER